jgi:hypothetical protein
MKNLPALMVAAIPATSLLCQVNASLTTVTPVAAAATASSVSPASFVGVPAGAPANALNLVTSGYGTNGALVGASTATTASGGAALYVRCNLFMQTPSTTTWSTGTSPSPSAAGAAFGPVEFLGRIQAPAGTRGSLTLSYGRATLPASGAIVNQGLIDVGADGTPERITMGTGMVRRTIPANGELPIRFVIENHATTAAASILSVCTLSVIFNPDPPATCTITAYGTPCGAQSSGSESSLGGLRAITLLSSGGFAQAPVFSAFGTQNSGPVLPGGCQLLNEGSALMLLTTDAAGFAVQTITVPVSAIGTLYQQFVPLDPSTLAIRASNGLAIDCAL